MKTLLICVAILTISKCSGLADTKSKDIRCRCTCLEFPIAHLPLKIYKDSVSQDECNCDSVVISKLNNSTSQALGRFISQYCLRCECKYDVRSTKTMQVVVFIYLSLIGTLGFYMIGLLLFEFGKFVCNKSRTPLLNASSEDSMTNLQANNRHQHGGSHVMRRLNSATEGWKKEVEKQRNTVFGRHDILQ